MKTQVRNMLVLWLFAIKINRKVSDSSGSAILKVFSDRTLLLTFLGLSQVIAVNTVLLPKYDHYVNPKLICI